MFTITSKITKPLFDINVTYAIPDAEAFEVKTKDIPSNMLLALHGVRTYGMQPTREVYGLTPQDFLVRANCYAAMTSADDVLARNWLATAKLLVKTKLDWAVDRFLSRDLQSVEFHITWGHIQLPEWVGAFSGYGLAEHSCFLLKNGLKAAIQEDIAMFYTDDPKNLWFRLPKQMIKKLAQKTCCRISKLFVASETAGICARQINGLE